MISTTPDRKIQIPPCSNSKVPAPEVPFNHLTEVQTRFNDFDMLGHLNNSVYFQFMDLAKVSYFEAVLGKPVEMKGIGVVIVNININFYSPAYFGEGLAVVTACTKISKRSFILEQRVLNPTTGDVKCVATTVMASFDPSTATSPELDPEWSASLRSFEKLV